MHGTFTTKVQEFCGARFCYRQSGVGDPVLMLHASACTGGSWRGVINGLDPEFCFYTPDLAGFGQSVCEYLQEKPTLAAEAEFVAPLLWESTKPFHVVGHSFGGAVALAIARVWPERIKTLTVYEPTAFSVLRDGEQEDRRLLDEIASMAAEMRRQIANGHERLAMARFIDFWSGQGSWDRLPAAQQDEFGSLVPNVMGNFHALFNERWHAQSFTTLRCPVTILRGDSSLPLAFRTAEMLAALIPQARLVTVSGAAHMAPVTHPRLIAPRIAECLGSSERTKIFQLV
jgi:pimeloyl-ACP methyl ester carboxylesterase